MSLHLEIRSSLFHGSLSFCELSLGDLQKKLFDLGTLEVQHRLYTKSLNTRVSFESEFFKPLGSAEVIVASYTPDPCVLPDGQGTEK